MHGRSRNQTLLNQDFKEMLSELNDGRAEFLLIGAYALAAHGYPRATGDMDLWVRPEPENATRVYEALAKFGAPLHELSADDLSKPDVVFQIGVAPCRIDILTTISGVEFTDAWKRRMTLEIEGVVVNVIGRQDLIANKRACGRPKDIADINELESD